MRKIIIITISGIFLAMVLNACRTPHSSCPAYGGESKRYKIERTF